MKFKLSEIFATQQFEAVETGKTTIFIRFLTCMMTPKCEWCDVRDYEGKEYSLEEIIRKIKKYKNINHITFTGGSICDKQEEMNMIMNHLQDYTFSGETNGLIYIPPILFTHLVVSPKKQNINEEVLLRYKQYDNVFYKFVVEDNKNYKMWKGLISKLNIPKNKVYMMPEGITRKKIIEGTRWLSDKCIRDGYNVSSRLQIILYGKKKGK